MTLTGDMVNKSSYFIEYLHWLENDVELNLPTTTGLGPQAFQGNLKENLLIVLFHSFAPWLKLSLLSLFASSFTFNFYSLNFHQLKACSV